MQLQKTRSPTLQTVLMVDDFIRENSGEFKKTSLFHSLPKKMLWGTFQVIIDYLEEINKIGFDREGYVIYIWDPEIFNRFKDRPDIEI